MKVWWNIPSENVVRILIVMRYKIINSSLTRSLRVLYPSSNASNTDTTDHAIICALIFPLWPPEKKTMEYM